jgi:hypothetical protein
MEEPLPVLLPPFVELPVCLAVPEEPVVALFVFEEESVFEPEFVFEADPVFVAAGLFVCVAEPEPADC